MARVSTGDENLDLVLHGGFPEHSINLIVGLPGTGKTLLAESVMYRNAAPERKALYITTLSEPISRIVRYVQDYTFFKPEAVGDYFIYEPLGDILREEGLKGGLDRIKLLVERHNPAYLAIDSFRSFHYIGASKQELTELLNDLAAFLTELPITSFWVGEYAFEQMTELPEFTVSDGIIELVLEQAGARPRRRLLVMKLRGSGFDQGTHAFNINEHGLDIFPRLVATKLERHVPSETRYKSGIEKLDTMVDGGFFKGSSTAVFGPAGIGKTIACLHFINEGIRQGERCLIATLDQDKDEIIAYAKTFGWDFKKAQADGLLEIEYFSPDTIYVDELGREVMNTVMERSIQRLVIDSVNDIETASPSSGVLRDFMYALTRLLVRHGVSLMMTYETLDLYGVTYLSEYGISHIADNAVLLYYVKEGDTTEKLLTVLKSRRSHHDARSYRFEVTPHGITVIDAG